MEPVSFIILVMNHRVLGANSLNAEEEDLGIPLLDDIYGITEKVKYIIYAKLLQGGQHKETHSHAR
jgi:hypothetical protein